MSKEAMKLAPEALENSIDLVSNEAREAEKMYANVPTRLARVQGLVALEVVHEEAITALREALAEQLAQQEPVAYAEQSILDWLADNARGPTAYAKTTLAKRKDGKAQTPLYTSPPAQQEPKQGEIFCGVDFADGLLSVSVLRRRADDVAELLHLEQIALPLAKQPAQQEPAPGYCKHCKQYTIEEPLPAQRIWVGLVWGELPKDGHDHDFLRGATWAEAKLKEKNT